MARVNITVPDVLIEQARAAGMNVSRLASSAIEEELLKRIKIAELDAYLAELDEELGPPTLEATAAAEAWADRVFGPDEAKTGAA